MTTPFMHHSIFLLEKVGFLPFFPKATPMSEERGASSVLHSPGDGSGW